MSLLGKDRAVGIALALLVRFYDINYKVYEDISKTPYGMVRLISTQDADTLNWPKYASSG